MSALETAFDFAPLRSGRTVTAQLRVRKCTNLLWFDLAKRLGYLGEKTGDSLDVQVERIDKMIISGLIRHQRAMEGRRET